MGFGKNQEFLSPRESFFPLPPEGFDGLLSVGLAKVVEARGKEIGVDDGDFLPRISYVAGEIEEGRGFFELLLQIGVQCPFALLEFFVGFVEEHNFDFKFRFECFVNLKFETYLTTAAKFL